MTATSVSLTIPIAKDLLTGAEWGPAETRDLLDRTADIKARPSRYASVLRNKHIALIFEKPSLRTRVTFEVGIQSMGGFVVFLDHTQARLGERESIPDVARNLEQWVQGIVARVYEQRVLEEMAATITIPVVNALSDKFHPCQALADFFTLEEKFGSLKGFKLAYVGDGNNVCHSLDLSGGSPRRAHSYRDSRELRAGCRCSGRCQARCQGNTRQNRTLHRSSGSRERLPSRIHGFLDQHGL